MEKITIKKIVMDGGLYYEKLKMIFHIAKVK
jgi:hypothetical protein